MERFSRPEKLDIDPSDSSASKDWEHWKRKFESLLSHCEKDTEDSKIILDLLINHVSPRIYSVIGDCTTYETAIKTLDKIFIKQKNIIYARHMLATRKQQSEENIDAYIQVLKLMAKDCKFEKVDAETNKHDSIRDAFISGIKSNKIRQRLLENLSLTLDQAYNQALSLKMAELSSQNYNTSNLSAVQSLKEDREPIAAAFTKRKCFFCGGRVHPRKDCPAVDANCQICDKKGHYANVCGSKKLNTVAVLDKQDKNNNSSACIVAASPDSLKKATVTAYIQEIRAQALIDTDSSIWAF